MTDAALQDFLNEERVTQWMRLMIGGPRKWLGCRQPGEKVIRPLDHTNGAEVDGRSPPRDHILAYRMWEVLCKSHAAYMNRYVARAGKEPKGRSPYSSLEDARSAMGTDFHWKNVHFREVGGVITSDTRGGEWIPVDSEPASDCRRCVHKGQVPAKHWHFRCPYWS